MSDAAARRRSRTACGAVPPAEAGRREPPPRPRRRRSKAGFSAFAGLSRSSSAIGRGIADIFTKRKLDAASLDDLEDILIQADLGLAAATRIREAVGRGRYDKGIEPDEVKAILADEVERALDPVARPLVIDRARGRSSSSWSASTARARRRRSASSRPSSPPRARCTLAAGDTFRAAAIEQLRIWARRAGADIVARDQGGDAAGLAFDA